MPVRSKDNTPETITAEEPDRRQEPRDKHGMEMEYGTAWLAEQERLEILVEEKPQGMFPELHMLIAA